MSASSSIDRQTYHPIPRNLRQQFYEHELAKLSGEISKWLEDTLHITIEDDLFETLRDGVILCDLVNKYFPMSHTPAVHRHTIGDDSSTYAYIENVQFFVSFLRTQLHFPDDLLFDANDLFSLDVAKSDGVLKRDILLSVSLFAGYLDAHGADVAPWDKHRGQFTVNPGDELLLAMQRDAAESNDDADADEASDNSTAAATAGGSEKKLLTAAPTPMPRETVASSSRAASRDKDERVRRVLSRHEAQLTRAHAAVLSSHGWSTLYAAAWYGRVGVIEQLVRKLNARVDEPIPAGFYAVHAAAYRGHARAIDALVRLGATVDVYSPHGQTPLCDAVAANRAHATTALLRAGAAVDGRRDAVALTPLHAAVHRCRVARAGQLVRAGADVNATFHEKRYTALHLAVVDESHGDRASMVPVVLQLTGVRINEKTATSSTPLMLAAMHGNLLSTKALIAAGADLSLHNEQGRTALDIAVRNGRHRTAKLLADAMHVDVPTHAEHPTRIHPIDGKLVETPPTPSQPPLVVDSKTHLA